MENQKQLILKIIFGSTKFKHSVKEPESQTFKDLKNEIYSQLLKLNAISQEKAEQIQLYDSDDFLLVDENKISELLKNNDLINVKFLASEQQQQQPQLPQQEQETIAAEEEPKPLQQDPKEAICVLYDTSGSMSSSYYNDPLLSRIGAVNSWFSAFADKTLVFEFDHLVQLICFSSQVKVRCEFNKDFEKFIALVDDVKALGSTKLYDACSVAIENLLVIRQKYPKIILRIIALTDGEDNQSSIQPQSLVKKIIENKIVIDSFVVGDNCVGLKTLTHASGGRCYCPKELNQGMQLFEIETILSVEARDIGSQGFDSNIDLATLRDRPFDTEGIKQSQKQLKQQSEKPEVMLKKIQEEQKKQESTGKTYGTAAQKRIIKELNDYINSPLINVKMFPNKDNLFSWKALLIGPKGTSYNLGCFLVSVQFPADYPFKPPKIQFLTKIYHCNISSQGSLCMDILRDQWSPALTITKVFQAIGDLLVSPNQADALESSISSLMIHEPQQFQERVIEETLKYANADAGSLVQLIQGGDQNQMNLDEFDNLRSEIDEWLKKNRA